MTATFVPTIFDKAFVKAAEFILRERIAPSQKWLATEMNILPQTLSSILKGSRGVPKEKKDLATFVLVEKCNVRKEFLNTGKGAILKAPVEIDSKEYPQYEEVVTKLEECERERQLLRVVLSDKEMIIKTQQELIESLRRKN